MSESDVIRRVIILTTVSYCIMYVCMYVHDVNQEWLVSDGDADADVLVPVPGIS
jgi:hypothetical protein